MMDSMEVQVGHSTPITMDPSQIGSAALALNSESECNVGESVVQDISTIEELASENGEIISDNNNAPTFAGFSTSEFPLIQESTAGFTIDQTNNTQEDLRIRNTSSSPLIVDSDSLNTHVSPSVDNNISAGIPKSNKSQVSNGESRNYPVDPSGSNNLRLSNDTNRYKKPYMTLNLTQNSQNDSKIILIKPISNNSKDLIHNPIEIVKSIRNSPFSCKEIKDIRVNKKRNILVAELQESNMTLMTMLLKVTKLGDWQVTCQQPNSDAYFLGVISPISPQADPVEIQQMINDDNPTVVAVKIDRLVKRVDNAYEKSASLKVTFGGAERVTNVIIGSSYYKVRPYVADPVMCFNCQRPAHTRFSCKAKTRCLCCGGPHSKEKCLATTYNCANCGGAHMANDKICPYMAKAREIEDYKARTGVSHKEAHEQIILNSTYEHRQSDYPSLGGLPKQQITAEVHHQENSFISTQTSSKKYSDAVRPSTHYKHQPPTPATRRSKITSTEPKALELNAGFFESMRNCLIELFQTLSRELNPQEQKNKITETIEKQFNIALSADQLLPTDQTVEKLPLRRPMESVGQRVLPTEQNVVKKSMKRPMETKESEDDEDESTDADEVLSDACTNETSAKKASKNAVFAGVTPAGAVAAEVASASVDSIDRESCDEPEFITVEKKQVRVNPHRNSRKARSKPKSRPKRPKKSS